MAANPRAAAVAALVRQEQDGFSNLVLDAALKRQQLEGRDKAFARALFYTVLEHRGTLDYILCQFLPKGLAKLDAVSYTHLDVYKRQGANSICIKDMAGLLTPYTCYDLVKKLKETVSIPVDLLNPMLPTQEISPSNILGQRI